VDIKKIHITYTHTLCFCAQKSLLITIIFLLGGRGTNQQKIQSSIRLYNKGNGGNSRKMFFYLQPSSSNLRELMKINNQRKLNEVKKDDHPCSRSFFLKNQQQVNSIKITENIII
jgi:hypothetical protein